MRPLPALQFLDRLINRLEGTAYRLSGSLIKMLDVLAYLLNLATPLYIGAIWGGFLPDLEKRHALTALGEWGESLDGPAVSWALGARAGVAVVLQEI